MGHRTALFPRPLLGPCWSWALFPTAATGRATELCAGSQGTVTCPIQKLYSQSPCCKGMHGVLVTVWLSPSVYQGLWAAVTDPVQPSNRGCGREMSGHRTGKRPEVPGPPSLSLVLCSLPPCLLCLLYFCKWPPSLPSPHDPKDTREPSLAAAEGKPREGARGRQGILPKGLQSREVLAFFLKTST